MCRDVVGGTAAAEAATADDAATDAADDDATAAGVEAAGGGADGAGGGAGKISRCLVALWPILRCVLAPLGWIALPNRTYIVHVMGYKVCKPCVLPVPLTT